MRARNAGAALAAVAASAALLAGCATTVDGHGRPAAAASNPSHRPDFTGQPAPSNPPGQSGQPTNPGPSGSGPPAATPSCPHVVYPHAHLSFDCITDGMQLGDSGVWPLSFYRTVEKSTGWVLEEGAGRWGEPNGQSLGAIAANVRQQMVDNGGYGDNPKIGTVADKDVTVGGVKAHLLQTTMTLDPAWAQQDHTTVKEEHLWIVALQVGPDDVSLWYTSIPDLAKQLWPKVPSVIDTIHVG